MRWMLVALVATMGCTHYPHDRPVAVAVDDHFGAVAEHLFVGSQIWNELGAKFGTVGEQTLRIVTASDPVAGEGDAWYSAVDGQIHVVWPPRVSVGDPSIWRAVAAHEVGHAMGLDHLDGCAIMAIGECGDTLSDADIAAFQKL